MVGVHTVNTHAGSREPELPSLSTLFYGHNHIPYLKIRTTEEKELLQEPRNAVTPKQIV